MKVNIGGIINRFSICKNLIKKYGNILEFYDGINMCWAGGRLNNRNNLENLKPILKYLDNRKIFFNLVASNYYIDIYDKHSNEILKYLSNFENIGIILNNNELYEHLKKNYNFKLKYSVTGLSDKKCDLNLLHELCSKYDTVCVRNEYLKDKKFLSIRDKQKYEIMLTKCGPECDKWKEHFDIIAKTNLKYKYPLEQASQDELDKCLNCWYLRTPTNNIDIYKSLDWADWGENDLDFFKKIGFTRFKLPGRERNNLDFFEYSERFIKWIIK